MRPLIRAGTGNKSSKTPAKFVVAGLESRGSHRYLFVPEERFDILSRLKAKPCSSLVAVSGDLTAEDGRKVGGRPVNLPYFTSTFSSSFRYRNLCLSNLFTHFFIPLLYFMVFLFFFFYFLHSKLLILGGFALHKITSI